MIARTTKSMALVNVRTPAINHILDFEDVRADVIASLTTLERLRVFAMSDRVRQMITGFL